MSYVCLICRMNRGILALNLKVNKKFSTLNTCSPDVQSRAALPFLRIKNRELSLRRLFRCLQQMQDMLEQHLTILVSVWETDEELVKASQLKHKTQHFGYELLCKNNGFVFIFGQITSVMDDVTMCRSFPCQGY